MLEKKLLLIVRDSRLAQKVKSVDGTVSWVWCSAYLILWFLMSGGVPGWAVFMIALCMGFLIRWANDKIIERAVKRWNPNTFITVTYDGKEMVAVAQKSEEDVPEVDGRV